MKLLVFLIMLLVALVSLKKLQSPKAKVPKKCGGGVSQKIRLYGHDGCGFTVKMKKMIESENKKHLFDFIDTSTKDGSAMFEKLKVSGVPAFEYKSKVAVGAMPLNDLFSKLNFIN